MNIKKIFNGKIAILFLVLFCLLIIGIWFKDGKLLATGEEGLILANPYKSIKIYEYSWNEVRAGGANPGSNVMVPFLYAEFYLTKVGIPVWFFQAATFFMLMLIGSSSIYFLTKELLEKSVKKDMIYKLALVAALFYILNPVSLLGVWYRFLLTFMFFYALVPLFLFLFIFGLNRKKFVFIIIAPLISLLFLFGFANAALVLLLWLLPFIYTLSLIRKYNLFPLIYFCLTFLFWLLINYWWLYPYTEFSKTAYFADKNNFSLAVNTLKANSQDFALSNVMRLIHGGFLYKNEDFGSIYKNPIFLFISWLIPLITFYGLWKLKAGFNKLFLTISLILLLFLAKGTSFPFGRLFLWFFSHVSILQVFRNPLEKFGMLLPTIYAPLFAYGLVYFLLKISNVTVRKSLILLVPILLIIFNWPFFTGAMVSFANRDIRVEVPSSFEEANRAISEKNHIILSIPVMGGASGFHKWKYGYRGVETGQYLFNSPVITEFYDNTSFFSQILIGFSNDYLHNLIGVAQLFSADIIAYRKDTDVAAFGYNLDGLERSKRMIDQANLIKVFDSSFVSLWILPTQLVVPVIYTPLSIRLGNSSKELITLLENNKFDPKTEVYICNSKDECNPYLLYPDISQIRIDAIPPEIEFKKLSPVNYSIEVKNSKGRFLLVFNNTYHPGWEATVEGRKIPDDSHFIANGYANGFIIDQPGNFNISLKFKPEEKIHKYYKISLIAISLGVLISFGLIVKERLKSRIS